jgi:hypothetical protein
MLTMKAKESDETADPVKLAGAIRDVIRPLYTREMLFTEARRRGCTVEAFEVHLARQHLRDLDTLGGGPAPRETPAPAATGDTLPALLSAAERQAAVKAKRAELVAEFGAETIMWHLGRHRTIDQLAASLVDHPEQEA